MKKWLRRMRGAVGMGLVWGVAWGLCGVAIALVAKLIPGALDPSDAPLPALAYPGFIGGVLFSIVLGVAGRRRRFSDLSVRQFALWGALGGLLLSLVPAAMVAVGLAHANASLWLITGAIVGPFTVLCAGSAAGSLMLAKRVERGASLPGTPRSIIGNRRNN